MAGFFSGLVAGAITGVLPTEVNTDGLRASGRLGSGLFRLRPSRLQANSPPSRCASTPWEGALVLALSGPLVSLFQGFADVSLGINVVVANLAAGIIGRATSSLHRTASPQP